MLGMHVVVMLSLCTLSKTFFRHCLVKQVVKKFKTLSMKVLTTQTTQDDIAYQTIWHFFDMTYTVHDGSNIKSFSANYQLIKQEFLVTNSLLANQRHKIPSFRILIWITQFEGLMVLLLKSLHKWLKNPDIQNCDSASKIVPDSSKIVIHLNFFGRGKYEMLLGAGPVICNRSVRKGKISDYLVSR